MSIFVDDFISLDYPTAGDQLVKQKKGRAKKRKERGRRRTTRIPK
jgi:hypothetical protein